MPEICCFAIKGLKYAPKLKKLKICPYMQNKTHSNVMKTSQKL
jgi:hypothetical protein